MNRIYHELQEPELFKELLRSPAMKRIAGVEMNCGMRYTSFPLFQKAAPYTRLAHSRNVGKLVYHYTNDTVQAVAGLFHDIAAPVFSHVIDFVNGDYLKQESTEERTASLICSDPIIRIALEREGIPLDAVSDYHCYPIADNDMPKLSCDRLEYTLSNAVNYGFISPEEGICFLHDLVVSNDEAGTPELAFQTTSYAVSFAYTALRCGKIYSGKEDRYGMEMLSRLLKDALSDGVLTYDDFYTEESSVIEKLKTSSYAQRWDMFCRLHSVTECTAAEGIQVNAKRRYIDPLIAGNARASALDSELKEAVDSFLAEDYSVYLKGNYKYGTYNRNCQRQ